ncbi:MAG: endonuclease/exonuclease/phosphatase family protein, partial [Chitinophagaceae bacterium]|nr:endonuclease/exonuclease/phosphatase family protein [Chitinophagaceae bacterium]
ADVLCFQEFFHSTDPTYYDNLNYVMKNLGYPYYFYSWGGDGDKQWVGQIILSRIPITTTGMIRYPPPGMPESLIYADVVFRGDTIRFFTTHLQSMRLKKEDYERIESIKKPDDNVFINSRNIFSKWKRAAVYRSTQADIVKKVTSESPYPYILCGDFNDVPNSYTYYTISDGLQDAFLKKGFGIGRTYAFLSPTLRIDYILTTKNLFIQQFNRLVKNYSDHYMLVADVKFVK